jgi:type IV pilus assembly protein PilB
MQPNTAGPSVPSSPSSAKTVDLISEALSLETLILEEGGVSQKQIDRARRIAARLSEPKPLGLVLVELGQLARSEYERLIRLHRSRLALPLILYQDGALSDEGLARYRERKSADPGLPDREILVGGNLVTEQQFLQALCVKNDIEFVEPEVALVDDSLLAKASMSYLVRQRALPFQEMEGAVAVILADPLDDRLIMDLERIFGRPVKPFGAPSDKILEALRILDRLEDSDGKDAKTSLQYRTIEDIEPGDDSGEEAVRLVDYLLYRAIEVGASDLHIEPLQSRVRVRVRVDGAMRPLTELPGSYAARVVSRIKVLGGADIAERRLHQDGRLLVKVEDREIDIRLSTYASVFGETIVLRLLDRRRGLVPLDGLGFESSVLTVLRDVVLRASSGLVLVTGPTGSGKTTTLYSFIDYVLDDSIKVITSEDPVEYVLEGVTQCSVNEKSGPTFADSLRAMLRQDPDIIVLGEIRDKVTAELGVEAALTGHKVFCTFHTEDSVSAVLRLLDMGVEPFLVSSTLSCIVAQRLLLRLCEDCRRQGRASPRDLRFLGMAPEDLGRQPVMEGVGCANCGNTGYRGRLGIHEVLLPDDDFRDAVLRRAPSRELRALTRKLPVFLTLQEDGFLKAVKGETTLSEIADNVPRDPDARPLNVLREITSTRGLV